MDLITNLKKLVEILVNVSKKIENLILNLIFHLVIPEMKDDSDNVVIMKASRHKLTIENKNEMNTGHSKSNLSNPW